MDRVHRTDVGTRLRADHRTEQGQFKVPAFPARTGVQLYPQADGTIRREYRSPEEVFHPDSLATYETSTVTEGHPGTVDASNWRDHAIGDVRNVRRDGGHVAADLILRDATTIAKVDAGELIELSCGYDCMLEMRPGTSPEGERYDAVQTQIRVNHIGLGPKNWGRAGSEVRLRLDGGGVAYVESEEGVARPSGMTFEELKAKLDAAEKAAKEATARADALEAKSSGDADRAKIEAQRDEALAKAKKLEETATPDRIDTLVRERMAILDGARILHGRDFTPAKTDRETMIAAIVARDPEFKADGRSDDYIRARFDTKVEDAKKAGESLAQVNRFTAPSHLDGGARAGGTDQELAALMRHFDGAPDVLEAYHRADPWLNGEAAAMAAAQNSVFGG